jgi:hypothetical protein
VDRSPTGPRPSRARPRRACPHRPRPPPPSPRRHPSPEAPPEPPAEGSSTLDDPDDEDIDDGEELPLFDLAGGTSPEIPLTDAQIRELAEKHPEELGSLSIGSPNAGRLQGGVAMMKGNQWLLLDPGSAWGTQETIDALFRCVGAVHATHEDTPPVAIGHISAKKGGPLSPHVSHQSGRDVDIGYYYLPGTRPGFVRATAENLDRARSWTLVRAFLTLRRRRARAHRLFGAEAPARTSPRRGRRSGLGGRALPGERQEQASDHPPRERPR